MVRKATTADLAAIVAMAAKFYQTTSYAKWADFCPDSVEALAVLMIENGVMNVAEIDGQVRGMVGLVVAPFMFNARKKAAYEVVWWVDEEARGTIAGKALLASVEESCREAGCDTVQMVHLHNSPPQAAALYERMGYAHTESSFTKVL